MPIERNQRPFPGRQFSLAAFFLSLALLVPSIAGAAGSSPAFLPSFELVRIASIPVEGPAFGTVVLPPLEQDGKLLLAIRGGGLWTTDGTAAGTAPFEGCPDSCPVDVRYVARTDRLLYFTAVAGSSTGGETGLRNLWVTDFTAEGTRRLTDFVLPEALGPSAALIEDHENATLFFVATTPETGTELWLTQGTPESTRLAADLRPGPDSSFPELTVPLGSRLAFTADDGSRGREVWIFDHDVSMAELVADLVPGEGSSNPRELHLVDQALLFFAETPEGLGLLRLDRDRALPVTLQNPGSFDDGLVTLFHVAKERRAYFAITTEDSQTTTLWLTDGTAAGTFPVAGDFSEILTMKSSPVLPDRSFFTVLKDSRADLWVTDGTDAGTQQLLSTGHVSATGFLEDPRSPRFWHYDEILGTELWETDGTAEGTVPTFDLCPGSCSGFPFGFVTLRDTLLFLGTDENGLGVWAWDRRTDPELLFDVPRHLLNSLTGFHTLGTPVRQRALLFLAVDGRMEIWVLQPTFQTSPEPLVPRRLGR